MKPEAAIIEVAPVRHERLWRAVKDNLAKSDEHLSPIGIFIDEQQAAQAVLTASEGNPQCREGAGD
jgi:hypothetical protein